MNLNRVAKIKKSNLHRFNKCQGDGTLGPAKWIAFERTRWPDPGRGAVAMWNAESCRATAYRPWSCCEGWPQQPCRNPSTICGRSFGPKGEKVQLEQCLQAGRHGTQHNQRLPWYNRAEHSQWDDISEHPGEAGRPQIAKECQKQLGGLLQIMKRLRFVKKPLPLVLEEACLVPRLRNNSVVGTGTKNNMVAEVRLFISILLLKSFRKKS